MIVETQDSTSIAIVMPYEDLPCLIHMYIYHVTSCQPQITGVLLCSHQLRGDNNDSSDMEFFRRWCNPSKAGTDGHTMDTALSRLINPRQCISCLEEKPFTDYFFLSEQCRSRHSAGTCTACVTAWIRNTLQESGTSIACPQCPQELSYRTIQKYADRATFERYEMLLLTGLLGTEPTFVWCAHGCGSGQSHPGGAAEPILTCHHCRRQTCVVHDLPWHPGLTCGQFDELLRREERRAQERQASGERRQALLLQRARDDEASREEVRNRTKPCPKCHFDIEKHGGCDHMHCKHIDSGLEMSGSRRKKDDVLTDLF